MPAKDPLVYVKHIRDCCRRIAEYVSIGGPEWPANPLVMDAICRNIVMHAYEHLKPELIREMAETN